MVAFKIYDEFLAMRYGIREKDDSNILVWAIKRKKWL